MKLPPLPVAELRALPPLLQAYLRQLDQLLNTPVVLAAIDAVSTADLPPPSAGYVQAEAEATNDLVNSLKAKVNALSAALATPVMGAST